MRDYLRPSGLRAGERLPGERVIAAALGVGRTGLRPAMEALETEGALERRSQSGTFLAAIPAPFARGQSVVLIAPFTGTGEVDRHRADEWLYRVAAAF